MAYLNWFINGIKTKQREEIIEMLENRIRVLANVSDIQNVKRIELPFCVGVVVQELQDIITKLKQ